jgi:hypothetical protein
MGAEDNRSCFGEAWLLEVKTDDKPAVPQEHNQACG